MSLPLNCVTCTSFVRAGDRSIRAAARTKGCPVRNRVCSAATTLTRTGQFVAAAALTAGLAFTAAPIARADWDIGAYDACLARKGIPAGAEDYSGECCSESGGNWSLQQVKCVAPPPIEESFGPPPPPRSVIVTPVAPGSKAPILSVSPGGQAPTQAPMG
jgi:hypothetical protein